MAALDYAYCQTCGERADLASRPVCLCGVGAKRPISVPSGWSEFAALRVLQACGIRVTGDSVVFRDLAPMSPRGAHAIDRLLQAAHPEMFAEKVAEHVDRASKIEAAARGIVEHASWVGSDLCMECTHRGARAVCREMKIQREMWCYGCDLAQAIDEMRDALEVSDD